MPPSEQKLSRKPMKFASTPQRKILFNNLFLAEALFNYSMLLYKENMPQFPYFYIWTWQVTISFDKTKNHKLFFTKK